MAKLLDKINYPSDLRKFEKKDLKQISEELRKQFPFMKVTCFGENLAVL